MVEQVDRPVPAPEEVTPMGDPGFTLIAVHSADRMTRALSPWTRMMLGVDTDRDAARHALVDRILKRRLGGSSTFGSTLSILKRFHRVVARSVAWTPEVGSVDPNLFSQFVDDLANRQKMGANNMTALIRLGDQRRQEMGMPLVGDGSTGSSSESATSAAAMAGQMGFGAPAPGGGEEEPPRSMAEILRRIQEANKFRSNTPDNTPNFVKAAQKAEAARLEAEQEAQRKAAREAAMRAEQGQRPQLPPGMAHSAPPPQEPTGDPAAAPDSGQRIPPRMRRRRFASVEYVNVPDSKEEDDDGESSPGRFDNGPPGVLAASLGQWLASFADPAVPLTATAEDPARPTHRRRPQRRRKPRPHRTLQRSHWPRRTPRPIGARALQRLSASLSGDMLASRPQQLMAQVLGKEASSVSAPPRGVPGRTAPGRMMPGRTEPLPPALSPLIDDVRRALPDADLLARYRTSETRSALLPISTDDFVVPPWWRLQRQVTEEEPAGDRPVMPMQQLRPSREQRTHARLRRAPGAPPRPRPGSEPSSAAPFRPQPPQPIVHPETALVQLQAMTTARPPTVLARHAPLHLPRSPHVRRTLAIAAESIRAIDYALDSPAVSASQSAPPRPETPRLLAQETTQTFAPASDAWRRGLLREEPTSIRSVSDELAQVTQQPDVVAPRGSAPRTQATLLPLEFAMQRLLGESRPEETLEGRELPRGAAVVQQPVAPARLVRRMEEQGWRFKRSRSRRRHSARQMQGSVEQLERSHSRPLARPVRTLMERVLGRDFAGVRVQMASLGPLNVEAAARADTVYLSPEIARLDRPRSLGVLAHELTHVAARGRARRSPVDPLVLAPPGQMIQPRTVQRQMATEESAPPPFAARAAEVERPPQPRLHRTRQLSQRLVGLSLGQEERVAEQVEQAVVQMASSAQGARRFAPISRAWRNPTQPSSFAESAAPLAASPDRQPDFEAGGMGRMAAEAAPLAPERRDPARFVAEQREPRSLLSRDVGTTGASRNVWQPPPQATESLLTPGSLVRETLSQSDLVQRDVQTGRASLLPLILPVHFSPTTLRRATEAARPSSDLIGRERIFLRRHARGQRTDRRQSLPQAQTESTLAERVLVRRAVLAEVRRSQPRLLPPAVDPLPAGQPADAPAPRTQAAHRRPSAPRSARELGRQPARQQPPQIGDDVPTAIQRRAAADLPTTLPATPVTGRALRRAVEAIAARPARIQRFDPVSALWRPNMLAAGARAAEERTTPVQIRRQMSGTVPAGSPPPTSVEALLRPGSLAVESLSASELVQRRRARPRPPLPLSPPARSVRQATAQVASVEPVAARIAQLSRRAQAQRRSPDATTSPDSARDVLQQATEPDRLVRRRVSSSPLLERIVARDFADLRRDALSGGLFRLPERATPPPSSQASSLWRRMAVPASKVDSPSPSPGPSTRALTRSLIERSRESASSTPAFVQRSSQLLPDVHFTPVSEAWRPALLRPEPVAAMGDELGRVAVRRDLPVQRTAATATPLQLSVPPLLAGRHPTVEGQPPGAVNRGQRRLDRTSVSPTAEPAPSGQRRVATDRRTAGGGHRRPYAVQSRAEPLMQPAPTLLERVLGRDFAGVRRQMASMGPLDRRGLSTAQRDRAESLVLAPPPGTIQRQMAAVDRPGQPAPSTTRRLSRRLVGLGLARADDAVRQMPISAQIARRFEPISHSWRGAALRREAPPSEGDEVAPGTLLTPGSLSIETLTESSLLQPERGDSSNAQRAPLDLSPPAVARTSTPRQPSTFAPPQQAVQHLETQGWRFKRADRVSLAAPERVQRAVAQLQQRAEQGRPLPRPQRTLMESVLQRDLSKVRLRTAPLQTLGVEGAAKENTIYLSPERAARLDRPETLSLLGHELTHVAASGHAPPVRRAPSMPLAPSPVRSSRRTDGTSLPLPSRPLMPRSIQRSVVGEEMVAAQVESDLRGFLQRSAVADSEMRSAVPVRPIEPGLPLAATVQRSTASAQRVATVQRTPAATPTVRRASARRPGPAPLTDANRPQLASFRGGEEIFAGVPSTAMEVAPPPVRRRAAGESGGALVEGSVESRRIQRTSPDVVVQRQNETRSASDVQARTGGAERASGRVEESPAAQLKDEDYRLLAEKIYPLLRRRLLLERERGPR